MGERLTNALSDCTSLLREGNKSYVSSDKIESKYNGIERVESGNRERENEDYEEENGGREG